MFTLTNIYQMPTYLSESFFEDWFKKFNQSLAKIGLPAWNFSDVDIGIEFSCEEKNKSHGTISLEDVKDIIRKKWKTDKRTEKLLSEINNVDDYYNRQMSSPLAEDIHANNPKDSYEKIREILDNLFGKIYFNEYVLGEYCHARKTIVLYTTNIEHAAICGRTVAQNFEVTFIHELFHAYHYKNNDREIRLRHDYTSEVVKESFASAFEWNYCVEYKFAGDRELYWKWQKYSVLAYPYSGAQYLVDLDAYELQATDFCAIFKMSLTDMDQSLRILTLVEFYGIKNLIQYCEKEVGVTDLRAAFDQLMKQDPIGVIAHREITSIIRKPKNRLLIPKLMDLDYSKKYFHATQYPILATSPMVDAAGRTRSYVEPVHCQGRKVFYLSQQWNKDQLDLLLDWIWTHR